MESLFRQSYVGLWKMLSEKMHAVQPRGPESKYLEPN